ncbi:hypothetical protein CKAH01_00871 [Colletotrichum kahawae]|uniref:Uncharacterized protein n=1 Tax=Colletotrichum kahawae TaxID=34407 RepID=A0AAD9YLA2_COLKA|nr:hypothetical protein CKAH01_00871 [Colletotrichum kahawae]
MNMRMRKQRGYQGWILTKRDDRMNLKPKQPRPNSQMDETILKVRTGVEEGAAAAEKVLQHEARGNIND